MQSDASAPIRFIVQHVQTEVYMSIIEWHSDNKLIVIPDWPENDIENCRAYGKPLIHHYGSLLGLTCFELEHNAILLLYARLYYQYATVLLFSCFHLTYCLLYHWLIDGQYDAKFRKLGV